MFKIKIVASSADVIQLQKFFNQMFYVDIPRSNICNPPTPPLPTPLSTHILGVCISIILTTKILYHILQIADSKLYIIFLNFPPPQLFFFTLPQHPHYRNILYFNIHIFY